MPSFGKRSKEKLATLHPDLQKILNIAIKHVDFTILEGHRTQEIQDMYYEQGKTKVKYPNGKHNKVPSEAADIALYPIDWEDIEGFRALAFFIKGIAAANGIDLRLGADWDGDFTAKDQSFNDMPHIELRIKK